MVLGPRSGLGYSGVAAGRALGDCSVLGDPPSPPAQQRQLTNPRHFLPHTSHFCQTFQTCQ